MTLTFRTLVLFIETLALSFSSRMVIQRAKRRRAVEMEIPWISMIGSVAGISTTGAFLPQVIRTWRTHSTHDISLGMFLLTVFGLILWFIYGLELHDWPLTVADAVSLILAATILGLKLRYG